MKRHRLFIEHEYIGNVIKDAADPEWLGVSMNRDGNVSGADLVLLLNRVLPAPTGTLRCGGSGRSVHGEADPAMCHSCGQPFTREPSSIDRPWRSWQLPIHDQPVEQFLSNE